MTTITQPLSLDFYAGEQIPNDPRSSPAGSHAERGAPFWVVVYPQAHPCVSQDFFAHITEINRKILRLGDGAVFHSDFDDQFSSLIKRDRHGAREPPVELRLKEFPPTRRGLCFA